MFLTKSYSLDHKQSVARGQKYVKSKERGKNEIPIFKIEKPEHSIVKNKGRLDDKMQKITPRESLYGWV